MPYLLAVAGDWPAAVTLCVAALCSIAMVAVTLRWTIRLSTHEARMAQASGNAELAKQLAGAALETARDAEQLATRRADAIYGQYQRGERTPPGKRGPAKREDNGAVLGAEPDEATRQRTEIEEWYRTHGR